MLVKIAGRVRGLFAGNYPENREDEQFHLNPRGDMLVAQSLPERTEIVRMGETWQVATATALAALTAWPTTVAGLGIWNGEPNGGKSYVIDSVAAVEIVVDATQSDCTALFVLNNKTPVATPSSPGSLTIRSMSGRTYGGRCITALTANNVTNDGWFPAGNSAPIAPAVAGSGWKVTDVNLNGLYIVPPSGMFSVQAAKVAGAASQMQFIIRWHEVQLIVKS